MFHKEEVIYHEEFANTIFVVISGPSCGGKTSFIKILGNSLDCAEVLIKYTTRSPRTNETNGCDYYFVTEEAFESVLTNDSAIVKVERYGHKYGLSKKSVEDCLRLFKIPVFILDPDTALLFRKKYTKSIIVFIGPRNVSEIYRRLIERGCTKEEEERKKYVDHEYSLREYFDINDYCESETPDTQTLLKMIEEKVHGFK